MVYKDPLKIYITKRSDMFGHFITLHHSKGGYRHVAINLEMEKIHPGEKMPETASLPVDEKSLRELGEYLVGHGLITAPVTDRERKEHDELKIRFEMQEKLIDQMREQLKDSNTKLSEIAGVVQLAQNLTNK